MITHIVFDYASAGHLRSYLKKHPQLQGDLLVMTDDLSVGPLKNISARNRRKWWKDILLQNEFIAPKESALVIDDQPIINQLKKTKTTLYIWVAPIAFDELSLMRLSSALMSYKYDIYLIPVRKKGDQEKFLSLGQIDSDSVVIGQFLKNRQKFTTKKREELTVKWLKLTTDQSLLRIRKGPFSFKHIVENDFDKRILKHAGKTFKTPAKIYSQFSAAQKLYLNYDFFNWRLQELIKNGALLYQGDNTRSRKYKVKSAPAVRL